MSKIYGVIEKCLLQVSEKKIAEHDAPENHKYAYGNEKLGGQ
jgi:hypothetical protein